ncbi:MAG: hypothetical protein R6V07_05610 [Armatimonadota bacterium]
MARRESRPNVVAIIIGIVIGAIGGTLIGFITQWWWLAIGFAVAFVAVWMIAQRLWFTRHEDEIEDPYDGR